MLYFAYRIDFINIVYIEDDMSALIVGVGWNVDFLQMLEKASFSNQ